MQKNQPIWPLLLMSSSLLLLLVLELFWLRMEYFGALTAFRKETNFIFRNTIETLYDSLIRKSIKPYHQGMGDTLQTDVFIFRRLEGDVADLPPLPLGLPDSIRAKIQQKGGKWVERTGMQMVINSRVPSDSIRGLIRPLVSRMQEEKGNESFVIQLDFDSLKIEHVAEAFRANLLAAGIALPFEVVPLRPGDPLPEDMQHLFEMTKAPPFVRYGFAFSGTNILVLSKIIPQMAFSVLLMLVTLAAFWAMHRSLRMQQKMMALKNDFISNMTHELKTPIATVSVAIEALRNFEALQNPQRTAEYLDIAKHELSRLALLTDKVLKTAVFEEKGVDMNPEPIALDVLTDRVLASFGLVAEQRGATISQIRNGQDFTVKGSVVHLSNLLYNLLENALKYNPKGVLVTVELTEGQGFVRLAVRDNGIGIAPEYHQKVFEKFFRVPSGDVHDTKGYGLGLSYVGSVVRAHGGSIALHSELGKGSLFVVELPR